MNVHVCGYKTTPHGPHDFPCAHGTPKFGEAWVVGGCHCPGVSVDAAIADHAAHRWPDGTEADAADTIEVRTRG